MSAGSMDSAARQEQILGLVREHAVSRRLGVAILAALEQAVAQAAPLSRGIARELLGPLLQQQGLIWADGDLGDRVHVLEALVQGVDQTDAATHLEALLALGLGQRLWSLAGEARNQVLQSWLRLCDQLLVGSAINPYRFLMRFLDEPTAEEVFAHLAQQVAQDLAQPPASVRPVVRVRSILRLEMVSQALPPQPRDALLARIAASCNAPENKRFIAGFLSASVQPEGMGDPSPATAARAGRDDPDDLGEVLIVQGEVVRPARSPWLALLQALSGWSLVRGLGHFFGRFLLGARHRGELTLVGELLKIERRRTLLNRPVWTQEDSIRVGALQGWGLEHRRSTSLLLLGVLAFCTGGVVGLFILLDSLRAGFPLFGLIGLLIVGLGVGLDLGSLALHDLGAGRSSLWFSLPGQPPFRITAIPSTLARQLVDAIQRVQPGPKQGRAAG